MAIAYKNHFYKYGWVYFWMSIICYLVWDNIIETRYLEDYNHFAKLENENAKKWYYIMNHWQQELEQEEIKWLEGGESDTLHSSFEVLLTLDPQLKFDSSSILLITNNPSVYYGGIVTKIYEGKFKANIRVLNHVSYFRRKLIEEENINKEKIRNGGANIDVTIYDTLNNNVYQWTSSSYYPIYKCKRLNIKLDKISTFLAKTDLNWYYYGQGDNK